MTEDKTTKGHKKASTDSRPPGNKAAATPPARRLALRVLALTLDKGMDLQAALDQTLNQSQAKAQRQDQAPPDPRDAALATELSYGFLRLKGRVEFVLSLFLKDAARLHPAIRRAMALAAHEIMHLDFVPARASVHWAVDLAKSLAGPRLGGLVNAVLHKVADLGPAALDPGLYRKDQCPTAKYFSRYYSCPEWIVDLWVSTLGEEGAEACLKAQIQAPPLGLWVPSTGAEADALLERLAARPDCLVRQGRGLAFAAGTSLDDLGLSGTDVAQGRVLRQSLAAQEALLSFGPEIFAGPGPVWDCCAGRGNKTRHILALAKGPVLASDVHAGRLKVLRQDLGQAENLLVFRARADMPAPLAAHLAASQAKAPGLIVVDAPCTGLGVLSRRPDSKWKRTPEDADTLARLQAHVLHETFAALAPGGRLLYLTCTLNPAENQDQVQALLAQVPGAHLAGQWSTPLDSPLREFFFTALVEKGR